MTFNPDLIMPTPPTPDLTMPRREFLKTSATLGVLAGLGSGGRLAAVEPTASGDPGKKPAREFGATYRGVHLNRVSFPLGGIGAGMICLDGTGSFSHVSVRNRPEIFNTPCMFAAVAVKKPAAVARVLEGPVPGWKIFGARGTGWGAGGNSYGLPRLREVEFAGRFPFGTVKLRDPQVPLTIEATGWSPFTPGDADSSSLPVAAVEYRFANASTAAVEAVFSFHAKNFLVSEPAKPSAIRPLPGGFEMWGKEKEESAEETSFAIFTDDPEVKVNHAWFRGGWHDSLTMAWNDVESAACYDRPPVTEGPPPSGATLFVPVRLAPGESKTVSLRFSWYSPRTDLRKGPQGAPDEDKSEDASASAHVPWYAGRFGSGADVARYFNEDYARLREGSARFTDALFATTLPAEAVEAVAANLSILKSPTVLRQTDGRFWAWEGSGDDNGCCHGTCTHVWNYAQALAHLFPALERTVRETEFGPNQDEQGHQQFRASLPIREIANHFHSAADGQLGGIMKVHRDWRIGGDTAWLRRLWPEVKRSLDYCARTWDPDREGWLEEPHHNTYDIEFWGPDGMCTSLYLGALKAAIAMGQALGDDVTAYQELLDKGLRRMHGELFDGEYFIQKVEWKNLRAGPPDASSAIGPGQVSSPEGRALIEKEGPKYQYGTGCLSDGILGEWLANVCAVGPVLEPQKAESHLLAVHRHNFKPDLSAHANPQRPGFAYDAESGLLLCSWPKGGMPSLPFVYSNEVWTGIEYQVASHLCLVGRVEEGLEIVRGARTRYDGRVRNPFDEYECGHWYARALASYALLEALGGARYDAVDQVLHLRPRVPGDFASFLATATGYGVVGVNDGKPFVDVRSGTIAVRELRYVAHA